MKILAGILGALILLIQYPLWLGKGGWLRAWQIEDSLSKQKSKNTQLEVRNDEVFFQYENRGQTPISNTSTQSATSGSKKSH